MAHLIPSKPAKSAGKPSIRHTAQDLATRPERLARAGPLSWLLRNERQGRRLPCNTDLTEAHCLVCVEQDLPLKLQRDMVARRGCLTPSCILGPSRALSVVDSPTNYVRA